MRLSMAQMSMVNDIERNFNKALQFMDLADEHKADLLVFPEVALTPYFPQFAKKDVGSALNKTPDEFALPLSDRRIGILCDRCREYKFYASPNIYAKYGGTHYDMSLWLNPSGKIGGKTQAVHVTNVNGFYERDYFVPSEEGFRTFRMKEQDCRVGVVIGYDRHFPESIRACALKGAQLVVIPAANMITEPMEIYEMELKTAAYQNNVFVAMCNRVGVEGDAEFCGQSMVVAPDGRTIVKADDSQQFVVCNIDFMEINKARERRPYIKLRRPELYGDNEE